ncbi:TonB-dependent receptor domain-containing protein [Campylobacter suis]|uniref:Hemoglobin and hemoglobin-haptoglobin-binding protein n=1 Tax=Campylobacter suis TaxID=2790657 RepID=A0ABN7K334_9BACT|nr:TonB-dependent receptor [Campylobacter suis]CAD7286971.1 Hemoglobin and hemoglobin-haptoglobin-binding protein [Campylobacter suis]
MLCIFAASAITTFAADNDVSLDSIEVIEKSEQDVKERKVSEIKKTTKDLEKQQVSDTRDLVKYETGISVVESGRFGASGYSIRGVDENRVAIQIDGLQQAESINSQGFKDLFEGYGNFNNTRNGVEIENIKQANITKGADSIKAGSGALGGSVMFETKDARDYLIDKNWHYGFKFGNQTMNNENMFSHTLAAKFKWFDILAIRTDRDGHEIENYGYKTYDDNARRKTREKADPYNIKKESTLLKFGVQFNETNRLSIGYDKSEVSSKGTDWSYNLSPLTHTNITGGNWGNEDREHEYRHTHDKSTRKNISFVYENYDETPLWDSLKISYNKQNIKLKAKTEEYCDGGDKCEEIANPDGIEIKNSKLVDKYGNDLKVTNDTIVTDYEPVDYGGKFYTREELEAMKWKINYIDDVLSDQEAGYGIILTQQNSDILTDSKGKELTDSREYSTSNIYVNCDEHDCSKPLTLMTSKIDSSGSKSYKYKNFNLEKTSSKFAKLNTTDGYDYVVLPNSNGFVDNNWKDRDLNTDTKQVNLDLSKEFYTKDIEHTLSYGGVYSITDKSMVNRQGYKGHNKQWWNRYFVGTNKDNQADICKPISGSSFSNLCGHEDEKTSFLIPVETKTGALYLSDDIKVNEILAFGLGYRYDKIKHNPTYKPGVTPKISDDIVKGLFVPLETNKLQVPDWSDYANYTDYLIARKAYEDEQARVDAVNKDNAAKNISYISQSKEYQESSFAISTTVDPLDYLRIQAKYARGFRAPTSDELYFTFKHPDFTILPNTNLEAEMAKTKEVAFTFYNEASFLTIDLFRTDYENFIDLARNGYIEEKVGTENRRFIKYQNINYSKAKVTGLEISSKLDLAQIHESLSGFSLDYKLTRQKGKMFVDKYDMWVPMNAIQPKTDIFSVGYIAPSKKFGADFYVTKVKAKNPADTYNIYWEDEGKTKDDHNLKWMSTSYTTLDLIAFYQPIKNLTFRAGVYNMSDKKYLTWENARSIRPFGTSNMIDQETGLGINRFYSPGRNFKLTFEMTF